VQSFLDLLGVFAFALSGGARGVERRLDLFGVIFLAFVAATSGGILRDLLIGATPPYAISNWRYLATSTVAGLLCYFAYGWIERLSRPVVFFDAIGLGLSAVVGARKALDFHLPPLMAAVLGMLSAIGGGMARDVLTTRTPMVLQKDIYAVAALAGAAIPAFGREVGAPDDASALIGAALTIGVRLIAMTRNWQLPRAKPRVRSDDGAQDEAPDI
jgi:uncharacterized membrane protein YeiH